MYGVEEGHAGAVEGVGGDMEEEQEDEEDAGYGERDEVLSSVEVVGDEHPKAFKKCAIIISNSSVLQCAFFCAVLRRVTWLLIHVTYSSQADSN
jgi:hypothetical protein